MKRYLTLAIAIVLVLLCGMQTAADSAAPDMICRHVWVDSPEPPSSESVEESPCFTHYYDVYYKFCGICGATEESYRVLLYMEAHHSLAEGTDGQMYCTVCHGGPF